MLLPTPPVACQMIIPRPEWSNFQHGERRDSFHQPGDRQRCHRLLNMTQPSTTANDQSDWSG